MWHWQSGLDAVLKIHLKDFKFQKKSNIDIQ